jgi:AcrR family transcriptional regulator
MESGGRNARRRERTRGALIRAAQEILAEGGDLGVSIQAISDRADVGFGSVYYHFPGKKELFEAAFEDAFARYTEWRQAQLPPDAGPVLRFALNVRLTGRLATAHPVLARVLAHPQIERPLAPGLRDDLEAAFTAVGAGRPVDEVTVIAASGAIAAVLRATTGRTPEEQALFADGLARDLLRMAGAGEDTIAAALVTPL